MIVGDDDSLERLAEQLEFDNGKPPADILAQAAALSHPSSLLALRAAEQTRVDEFYAKLPPMPKPEQLSTEQSAAMWGLDPSKLVAPPAPEVESHDNGPVQACDSRGQVLERVTILILPTQDPTEAPAWLHWGNWNDCPPPEHHVAALRSWRDRHGAELVGLGPDTLSLRVARPPRTPQAAQALAREHHIYCPDTVDQGVGTLAALAELLLAKPWWNFWWD